MNISYNEFHISKKVRDLCDFDKGLFASSGNVVFGNMKNVRLFALKYNQLFTTPEDENKKVRFSKSIIVVILGLFSSFILSNINFNSYVEVSNFYNHIFLISRVFKTLIYTLIVLLLIFEEKVK